MIALDTNILVRYITTDDFQEWQLAAGLIEAEGQLCFLSNIVLCELVWVLRGKPYQFTRSQISEVLETMLATPVMEFENRSAVYQAWQRMKVGKADFSDYLITAISQQAQCSTTYSFNHKLIGEKGFQYPRTSDNTTDRNRSTN
ncbi:MAG: type II toxin-antitoxin system VapC family toxin [Chroococcus sp. CMT-3BRIN-NPC107]|nr:type II toxin-antitoxin system VapC family toxin [Chroococcus sp. CMT-3BRIN-NPC107]